MRRKLAVILAADVAGYSRLVAEDEDDTLRRLTASLAVFRDFVGRYEGRIFNTAGDAVLAEFSSALDAVRCAIDIQESLRTRNLAYPASRQMHFRIGLTIGDVVEEGTDLLGDGVNIAARLESIAPAGGICVSRSVHDAVASKIAVRFVDAGDRALKNMPEAVRAYTLAIADNAGGTEPAARQRLAPLRSVMLVVGFVLAGAAGMGGLWLSGLLPNSAAPPAHDLARQPARPAATPTISAAEPKAPPAVGPQQLQTVPPAAPAKPPVAPVAPSPPAAVAPPPVQTAVLDPGATSGSVSAEVREAAERRFAACRSAPRSEAVQLCTTAIAAVGLDARRLAEAHYLLGRALRDTGQSPAAISAYTRSIETAPTADAYIHRGIARFDERAFGAAIADFGEALRLEPNNGEALNNRAWTLYRMGNARAALGDADRAVSLLSTEGFVWDTRGHIHEALGERDLAIKDYRQAITLDPKTDSSRDGLKRLGAAP